MSESAPGGRAPRKPVRSWAVVAIAVGLGLVTLVALHGLPLTGQVIATWLIASAVGIVVFSAATAIRRRRGK